MSEISFYYTQHHVSTWHFVFVQHFLLNCLLTFWTLPGDMIEVFKITHDDPDVSLKLAYHSGSIAGGNKYKLTDHRFHYDLRKHYFSARTVNIWNSLPNHVVDVNTVNLFKARLDRFWMNQDVK